jgi:hypothetical protein
MTKDELSERRSMKEDGSQPLLNLASHNEWIKNKRVSLDVAGRVLNYNIVGDKDIDNEALDHLAERVAYLADQLMDYFEDRT